MASLIYHAGALGDFITILPAAALWRQAHGGEKIILLGKPAYAGLGRPPFDETWDVQARMFAGLFSHRRILEPELSRKLQQVSSALLFAWAESPLPRALAEAGVQEIVRQDPFPPSPTPIVDYHLSLFGGPKTEEQRIPSLTIPTVKMPASAPVVLHPGSGSERKNWPIERFLQLSRWFIDRGESVAWVLGPAEEGLTVPGGHAVWRSLQLPDLAGRLARCRLFVGNDSGITHLSAAAGTPTVALFGDSDPRTWAPRGRKVAVVASSAGGMNGIGLGDVLSVCQNLAGEK
jgi:Glycosyltransferase family 9 (heptosyltransferase)